MGTIDKFLFERAGARGTGDSDYNLSITTCCASYVVYDVELQDVYYNSTDLSKAILSTDDEIARARCPTCGSELWGFQQLAEWPKDETEWQWAYHPDPSVIADWQKS